MKWLAVPPGIDVAFEKSISWAVRAMKATVITTVA